MRVRRRPPTRNRILAKSLSFDAQAFLSSAGVGRAVLHYRPKQVVFSQGEHGDTVFYIQEGRVRLSVVSQQGKEATIALLGARDFLGKDA